MEDTLGENKILNHKKQAKVLILVLMEDTLGVNNNYSEEIFLSKS